MYRTDRGTGRAGEPLLGEVLNGKRLFGDPDIYASLLSRHLLDVTDFVPLQRRILAARRDAWFKSETQQCEN